MFLKLVYNMLLQTSLEHIKIAVKIKINKISRATIFMVFR